MKNLFAIIVLLGITGAAEAKNNKNCFDKKAYDAAVSAGLPYNCESTSSGRTTEGAISNAEITAYDCRLRTVSANRGKCVVVVSSYGKEERLLASPEVAAPWGNGYGEIACRPMSGLSMTVINGEIVTVRDSNQRRISTKFDYSR